MKPEEFEKIKQAEKEHLRKIRKLKDAVRQLDRQKKISGAISDMTSSMQETLDVHDEMIQKIAVDTALNEARLEIALERSEKADTQAQRDRDEADLAGILARKVVGDLRGAVESDFSSPGEGAPPDKSETVRSSDRKVQGAPGPLTKTPLISSQTVKTKQERDDLPEKTIGRMKP